MRELCANYRRHKGEELKFSFFKENKRDMITLKKLLAIRP